MKTHLDQNEISGLDMECFDEQKFSFMIPSMFEIHLYV